MSFDHRDIRLAMDVYTFDYVYLGTVLKITAVASAPVVEQTRRVKHQRSAVSGEMLGPMPTQPIGNAGPRVQGAAEYFATGADSARPLGHGTMTVGRWWGLVGRRTISLEDVQTVSLERVVLRRRKDELDRTRPDTTQE